MAGQDRPWAYWLLFSIHIADDLVRTGFLIFLPFLLRDKGADLPTIGLGLSLLFAGGAAGKLVMGWVGERLGVVPSVILTEVATTVADPRCCCRCRCRSRWCCCRLVGLMLNGTSSVLYGTVPEFVSPEKRTHAFADLLHRRLGGRRHRPVPVLGLARRRRRPADRAQRRGLHRADDRADGVGAAAGVSLTSHPETCQATRTFAVA